MMQTKIMIVEEGGELRTALARFRGAQVALESFPNVSAALDQPVKADCDIILWDVGVTSESIAEIAGTLRRFAKHEEKTPLILVSNSGAPEEIVNWNGEYLWLTRPFHDGQLKLVLDSALKTAVSLDARNLTPAAEVTSIEFEGMIAISLAMRRVFQQIVKAAAVDVPVLITGETGTGKDLVAAAIHKLSERKNAPYLPVNMGAIAPDLIASELFGHEKGAYTGASESRAGFFEQAQRGTLFLDEITTMDEKTQVSLLRVLETKNLRRVRGDKDIKVDVRVIAASNEKIEDAVKAKRFREDLYYRLDVFGIHVPPLRERSGGVSLLTDHFVSLFNVQYHKEIRSVSRETYRLLRQYVWPGNVRELKNVIQRAVLMAKSAEFTPDLLPGRIRQAEETGAVREIEESPLQLGMTLADVEKEYIKMTIASVGGNKMKAAEVLGVSRRALYNKLKRHGLM
jgi:DNA-binding NtrC family response regulator